MDFADINAPSYNGATVIHIASALPPGHTEGHLHLLPVLVELGADIDARPIGWTALHVAVSRYRYTAIIALLDAGSDPLTKDKTGRRALDLLLQRTNFIPEH